MTRGLSLHIALNEVDPNSYEGWDGKLVACENDADSMQKIASSLGYDTQKLITPKATRSAVIEAISEASRKLERDDIFLLTYSGHGGQVPDTNSDEPDRKDETWVLYDGELVDDELHVLYTQFNPGVRIFVLSDSCHSGTVTRAMYERTAPIEAEFGVRPSSVFRSKLIPHEVQAKVTESRKKMFEGIQNDTKAALKRSPESTVLLISGCQDNQLSSDGDVNGLFTEALLRAWNNGNFKQDYRHFQKAIKLHMPPSQQPNYFIVGAANKLFEHQRPFTITTSSAATRISAA
ncbi:caspase family protein [Edaphobacter aggregans]|uniref:caspase family protein n=1 Tax=Edaphobacter aggregans TaxID=570835 RepID=UPI00068B6906|nr:caspase family protein [Edaphobacter aggregans]